VATKPHRVAKFTISDSELVASPTNGQSEISAAMQSIVENTVAKKRSATVA